MCCCQKKHIKKIRSSRTPPKQAKHTRKKKHAQEHTTLIIHSSTAATPSPSSTIASSLSLRRDLSSSLRFMASAYRSGSFAFVVGILLSPGRFNQDTIALRSSRFQCLGIAPFALACSTLRLASALACCHLLLAANAFSSFCLFVSLTFCRTVPSLSTMCLALNDTPAIIFTALLKVCWAAATSSPWHWVKASFLACSRIFCSTISSIIVPANPSNRLISCAADS